ncbi:membrane protein insertion efficiency factor YidD [Alphaproteobacteria bacterium]|jgi:putative membrane protein insertion efficiency factor|nr:membrane protein insertion efficiency factor YidD [Alphaproteobacteria bacterium]MDB9971810.1 membrane protein insertion efficiency factor YidD [Alphaproteobacteria bacterium]|tara:strand:+ start:726 stop:941 length:216 start_codon:yes stop_codon:yes gene_type:complete
MIKTIFVNIIKLYQYTISPLLGPHCRFNPTCSNYAIESIKKHNILKALFIIIKRISRCHPWGKSGDDPVPD